MVVAAIPQLNNLLVVFLRSPCSDAFMPFSFLSPLAIAFDLGRHYGPHQTITLYEQLFYSLPLPDFLSAADVLS
jgi:hypothetical protein